MQVTMESQNCDFLNRYRAAFAQICALISEVNPHCIVAISRKGPRLLELFRRYGFLSGYNGPIIADKILDVLKPTALMGKKILVFDDVIVLGSTITRVCTILRKKFDAAVVPVVVGIDRQRTKLKTDPKTGEHLIEVKGTVRPETLRVKLALSFTTKERYEFCHMDVYSDFFTNKPFAIDFPIFNFKLLPGQQIVLFNENNFFETIDITTTYQAAKGFSKWVFLPKTGIHLFSRIFEPFLNTSRLRLDLCKLRGYYNGNLDETRITPMILLDVKKDEFSEKIAVFKGIFEPINTKLQDIKNDFVCAEPTQPLFRILCYIINYIFGEAALYLIFRKTVVIKPEKVIDNYDLVLLFGEELAVKIIEIIELCHKFLQEIFNTGSNFERIGNLEELPTSFFEKSVWDSRQEDDRINSYHQIRSYVKTACKRSDLLVDQIGSIFEGLYIRIETPYQYRPDIDLSDDSRLSVGFSCAQIKEILNEQNGRKNFPEDELNQFSLAIDYLVDSGVMIPIPYFDRKDGIYERAYRYGEDWYSHLRYRYCIAKVLEQSYKWLETQKITHIPKVLFEKLCILLFYYEIRRNGLSAMLRAEPSKIDYLQTVKVNPASGLYGAVLEVEEAFQKPIYYFYRFLEDHKMINVVEDKGISFSDTYLKGYMGEFRKLEVDVPELIESEELLSLVDTFKVLYEIDRRYDEHPSQNRFVTAIATCSNPERYIEALYALSSLFYSTDERKAWDINWILRDLMTQATRYEDLRKDLIEQGLSKWQDTQGRGTIQVVTSLKNKLSWRRDFEKIVRFIEDIIQDADAELFAKYGNVIPLLIEHIAHTEYKSDPRFESEIKSAEEELNEFSQLTVVLGEILHQILLVLKAIVMGGRPNLVDLNKFIAEWNRMIIGDSLYEFRDLIPLELPDCLFNSVKKLADDFDTNFRKLQRISVFNHSPNKWTEFRTRYFNANEINRTTVIVESFAEISQRIRVPPREINTWIQNFLIEERQNMLKLTDYIRFFPDEELQKYSQDLRTLIYSRLGTTQERVTFLNFNSDHYALMKKTCDNITLHRNLAEVLPDIAGKSLILLDLIAYDIDKFNHIFDKIKISIDAAGIHSCKLIYAPMMITKKMNDYLQGIQGLTVIYLPNHKIPPCNWSEIYAAQECQSVAGVIKKYGSILFPRAPLGIGDGATLIAYEDGAPACSLPILWGTSPPTAREWHPLYRQLGPKKNVCFISYAWDDAAHHEWVRRLQANLSQYVETICDDFWHKEKAHFWMLNNIKRSTHVLCVITRKYAEKANDLNGRTKGVGYEVDHMLEEGRQLIPLMKEELGFEESPSFIAGIRHIDFKNNSNYQKAFDELLQRIGLA